MSKILEVKLVAEAEEYGDLSYLGEYVAKWSPGCIDRFEGEERPWVHEYRYWLWAQEHAREYRWYRKHGWSKQRTFEVVASHKAFDFKRHEAACKGDWCSLWVQAKAKVVLRDNSNGPWQELTSGGCGGVESDAGKHLEDIGAAELDCLRDELAAAGIRPKASDWQDLCERALQEVA